MSIAGQQPVQFGISLPNRAVLFGYPWEVLRQTAEQAEASGCFDSVWVGDNFLSKPRLEAIVALSALAASTRRMKLGTVCLASFPLRDPFAPRHPVGQSRRHLGRPDHPDRVPGSIG